MGSWLIEPAAYCNQIFLARLSKNVHTVKLGYNDQLGTGHFCSLQPSFTVHGGFRVDFSNNRLSFKLLSLLFAFATTITTTTTTLTTCLCVS